MHHLVIYGFNISNNYLEEPVPDFQLEVGSIHLQAQASLPKIIWPFAYS
jgi:hypothetical protein